MTRSGEKKEEGSPSRVVMVGGAVLLGGILILVGLTSAYLGMRFAVRGNEVEVPALTGKSLEQARADLGRVALKLRVVGERFDSRVAQGAILSQLPGPGSRVKAERQVQVIISLGQKKNPVPDLRGKTLRVAQLMAAQAGYELGNISEMAVEGMEADRVVQQVPAPNSRESLSARIDVLVSRGSARGYVMPDLVGERINQAARVFERQHFKLGRIRYASFPGVGRGVVVKQFPEPGYLLREGETVNLEVAK